MPPPASSSSGEAPPPGAAPPSGAPSCAAASAASAAEAARARSWCGAAVPPPAGNSASLSGVGHTVAGSSVVEDSSESWEALLDTAGVSVGARVLPENSDVPSSTPFFWSWCATEEADTWGSASAASEWMLVVKELNRFPVSLSISNVGSGSSDRPRLSCGMGSPAGLGTSMRSVCGSGGATALADRCAPSAHAGALIDHGGSAAGCGQGGGPCSSAAPTAARAAASRSACQRR
mmetsp:Transcript_68347/g.192754  ORF Transcript_68347/g.192754 Transcript_68347/m.192754 type:complete len:234 (+) Transcript_68347:31-732(+)